MACVQQVRTSQETQLLPNQVITEQQSLVVMKKLLAIAVSGITYLRGLFPEKAYGNKYVDDQKVMILREVRSCPGASQIVQWMQGCFEAIQQRYLRTVIMSIYTDPENPQKVTEFYQFKIQYTAKGAQMDFESSSSSSNNNNNNNNKVSTMTCGDTKKASVLLVRKLYTLMQNLGPLPDNVCLNMKLSYYDDVTPQDYQPPGFKEADGDTMEFEREPVKLTMGEVSTPFHTLKMDMATERQRLEQVEESVNVMEKWVLKMEGEGVLSQSHVIEDVERPDTENTDLDNAETQLTCHEKMESREEIIEMDTLVKRTSDMEVGVKRTRSGRIIKSATKTNLIVNNKPTAMRNKMVSQYDIPNSQETPATSTPTSKRKFSEPKERY
ncbi:HORMA domain-containing protein 1 isoform X1 [Hippoglossus stenolepis]|uniref:HORMA domain-containing protein 1 isoform X1 n=1 Tax=Hippoglossus stenolepis TaxID=195615 RepID=UPI001FAFE50B|nr:HORMA domain-containing protein 1 isoform X1 [Hippoglossus stenolepis]XP_047196914.1 HORMA domain-containing protein 1 isoform X1 [Hippoglossus stenolepis]XP_047196915.1 HORMA domain-containing protein 1 isoform X1 [Hippoglossus stenolepis]XP_047196916.1 HORMA domain-containing protein 1 isoform X1 [Hippoglossus stenolepis]XP_047196917.1 HORMA domain-containing protein 1 isoform X1 [Hippoglossus stenolepis]